MHTAQLLSQALDLARRVGYQIREEALEGAGGGHYTIHDQKWLLIDLAQTNKEQLNDVADALRAELNLPLAGLPAELVTLIQTSQPQAPLRRAA